MIPKVDTFAMDIAEEIKHKEASLADIATASNDVNNLASGDKAPEDKSSKLFLIATLFLVVGILGLIGFIYFYFVSINSKEGSEQSVPQTSTTLATSTKNTNVSSLSSTIASAVGQHIKKIEKKNNGYILTLSSYSPVFAYMTRNEIDYIQELVDVLNTETAPIKKNTPSVSTSTSNASVATPRASTTQSTSTLATSSPEILPSGPTFSNVTLSNVNIRIYKDNDRSVAYSFISTDTLIIAKTADEVLSLRNAILR